MKILAVADPHGSIAAMKSIKRKAKSADIILLAGDFTIFERDMLAILKQFDSLERKVLVIPGNHEVPERVKEACDSFTNIFYMDEEIYEFENYSFMCVEGNGFAHVDEYFEKVAKRLLPRIKKAKKRWGKEHRFILMTHAPPYGTNLDRIWGDEHCGNESIREFIEKHQPDLAIAGHIHENNGTEDTIGTTSVINPGPEGRMLEL